MSYFVSLLATLMILSTSEACFPGPTTPLPPAPCPLKDKTCVDVRQTNVLAKKTVTSPLPLMCSKTFFKSVCKCGGKTLLFRRGLYGF